MLFVSIKRTVLYPVKKPQSFWRPAAWLWKCHEAKISPDENSTDRDFRQIISPYIKEGINTCDPRRDHTEPSSTPMTPAPITTIRLGTSFNDKAPVDDTTVSSSTYSK